MHTAKIIVSIILLLTLIIVSSSYTYNTLFTASERLDRHIAEIESNIKAKNWADASKGLSAFENEWSHENKTWEMLLDHFEIDNIDAAFARLSKYIETQDPTLALGEAASLKLMIKHIPEKEKLSINNIL